MANDLKSTCSFDLAARLRNAWWGRTLGQPATFDLVMEVADRLEASDPDCEDLETLSEELVDAG